MLKILYSTHKALLPPFEKIYPCTLSKSVMTKGLQCDALRADSRRVGKWSHSSRHTCHVKGCQHGVVYAGRKGPAGVVGQVEAEGVLRLIWQVHHPLSWHPLHEGQQRLRLVRLLLKVTTAPLSVQLQVSHSTLPDRYSKSQVPTLKLYSWYSCSGSICHAMQY